MLIKGLGIVVQCVDQQGANPRVFRDGKCAQDGILEQGPTELFASGATINGQTR